LAQNICFQNPLAVEAHPIILLNLRPVFLEVFGTPGNRARRLRVEPANNLLGKGIKGYVFARGTCLQFLDPGLGGLQVSNDFNPFEIHDAYPLQDI
jgi:hypothetical protein